MTFKAKADPTLQHLLKIQQISNAKMQRLKRNAGIAKL
jgi:hypothetical protein